MSSTPRVDRALEEIENYNHKHQLSTFIELAESVERENTAYKAALSAIFKILPTLAEFEPVKAAIEAVKGNSP
jgi:hypothetical protein